MMKRLFKQYFYNLESSLKTAILLLIPFAAFFSVMSDRNPYNYINIMVYGILSLLILFYVFKYKTFKFDIFVLLIVAFNFFILISQIVNLRILEYPRTILLLSIFSIVVYQFFINIENRNLVFKLILLGGLFFAAYFIIYYRDDIIHFNFANRIGDKFSDQNDLSKYLSIFGLVSIVSAVSAKKWKKIPYILSAILFLGIILLTGSISGLLCFLVCGLVLLVVYTKRQNRLVTVMVIASVALIIYGVLQLPAMSYFNKRITEIFNALAKTEGRQDGSAAERFALFQESLRLFVTRPLFGFGYDQVQYYTRGYGHFSHNNFTELAASFGIFGFLAYEVLLVMPVVKMFKNKKMNQNLFILTVFLFIFQIFLVIFRKKIEFILMPLCFSISCFGYYSYFEFGIENKKFFKRFVASTKAIDDAVVENGKQIKVLHLFNLDNRLDEHLNDFNNVMSSVSNITTIGITLNKEITKAAEFETYSLSNPIFKYRKLSFAIDKINPDVVYIDSSLLNFGFVMCIGSTRKIVCYLRPGFDETKVYKSRRIEYVAFSKEDKEKIESLSKKKKYHVSLLEKNDEKIKKPKTTYTCLFVGNRLLNSKYKSVVGYFVAAHELNDKVRFAIQCNRDAFEQLQKYFETNKIDYIDLFDADANLKELLLLSKSVIVLSSTKADSVALELYKLCDDLVLYRKPAVSIIDVGENGITFNENEDQQIIDKLVALSNDNSSKDVKIKTVNEEFAIKYQQYQYINLFMIK